jgi:O-antigen ligase
MQRSFPVTENQDRLTVVPGTPVTGGRNVPGADYWRRFPRMRRLLFLPVLVFFSLIIGLALGAGFATQALLIMMAGLVIGPLVWQKPLLGAYILIFALATVEPFNMEFPDSITDRVPFHKPLDQIGLPIQLTAAEIMMFGLIALIAVKRIGERKSPLRTGPIFVALSVFTAMVIYGIVRGLSSGGDPVTIVWEVRTLFYPFLMYLIIYNTVSTKQDAVRLMWIFIGAIAIKGLVGVFRFVVTLKLNLESIPDVSRANSLLSHEESLFFAAFLVFGLLLFIFRSDRKQLKFIAWAMLPVLLALMANQRRAGILAIVLSVAAIFIVVYVQMPQKRRMLIYVAVALMIFSVPYLTLFRNGGGGFIGEPAAAVLSVIRPDARDSASNEYRALEAENVGENIALNPYTGAGFGVPMQVFLPIPDLTTIFPLWAYVPHNTILYIWLRLGIVGFGVFWFLVGRMLLQSTIVARNEADPYLKAIALLTVTVIMSWVAQGLVDMGIVDTRLNMLLGTLVGLTAVIPLLKRGEETATESLIDTDNDPVKMTVNSRAADASSAVLNMRGMTLPGDTVPVSSQPPLQFKDRNSGIT